MQSQLLRLSFLIIVFFLFSTINVSTYTRQAFIVSFSCPEKYSITSNPVTFLISVSVLFLLITQLSAFTFFAFCLSLHYVLYYKCGGCLVYEIFVTIHQHDFFQTLRKALYHYFLASPLHYNTNNVATTYFNKTIWIQRN